MKQFLDMYHIIFTIGIDIIHFYVDVNSNLFFPLIPHFTLNYMTFEDENLGFFFWIFGIHSQVIFLTKYGNAHSKFVKLNFWKFIEGEISAFGRIKKRCPNKLTIRTYGWNCKKRSQNWKTNLLHQGVLKDNFWCEFIVGICG